MNSFDKQAREFCEYDIIEEESDQECGKDSSEDELEILLHGTPKQKQRLTRSISRGSLEMSSSEDEFDKEMEKELNEAMRHHEQQQFNAAAESARTSQAPSGGTPTQGRQGASEPAAPTDSRAAEDDDFYEDIYFDSDDEMQEGDAPGQADSSKKDKGKTSRRKHRVLTNDELLYDPDIDDQNQAWVNKQRQKYYPSNSRSSAEGAGGSEAGGSSPAGGSGGEERPIPRSDAVLNCPACLTTLCLDCQHHELYQHQYRAMFVLNCSIVRTERLRYTAPPGQQRRGGKWRRKPKMRMERAEFVAEAKGLGREGPREEYFYPVRCGKCNTEVAVYDSDEVFHFFNVLSSLS